MIYPQRLSKDEIIRQVLPEAPKRITNKLILDLWNKKLVELVEDSFEEAAEKISNGKKVVVLGQKFRIEKEDSDFILKSLWDRFLKIDSVPNLRRIIEAEEKRTGEKIELQPRLSNELSEKLRLWPYTLIKEAVNNSNKEDPPLGFYWVGPDSGARAISWIRSIDAAILKYLSDKQENIKIGIGKFYGRNVRVEIKHENEKYTVDLTSLSLHYEKDIKQYSTWLKFLIFCNCKDMSYRSRQHDKWVQNIDLFCKHGGAGFFKAIEKSRKEYKIEKGKMIRINPFPLPNESMLNFLDNAANKTLILDSDNYLRIPNKTELDQLIGAETVRKSYDNGWFHWQKRFKIY
jgi:hypothetical protein